MKHILTLAALVFGTSCFGQVPLEVPTNDLISWYGFDGNTDDAHTWQAHCEAYSPSFVLDRFGLESRAIDFDGVEDEMAVPDLGQYSDLNELTVSMWVKFAAYPDYSSEDGGHALFMKMQPVGANAVVQFSIYTEYDHNALRFDTRFANGIQINLRFEPFSESLETETWHHLACRFDGTKNQIFWEGVLVAESDTYPQTSMLNTSYDVMTSTTFGNIDRWQGSLDDLGTWSRALSMAEIQALFMAEAPALGCTDMTACNYNPDANVNDGSCYSCDIPAAHCGEGTFWDAESQSCVIANPSDTDFDGCVSMTDLLDLLSVFGTCNEIPWSCGDPLEYQGYDYETVLIGEQCWFAENLRAENYSNGDVIPANLGDSEWHDTSSGAATVYGEDAGCEGYSPDFDACNSAESLGVFGRLYNWYAVGDQRNLCPNGWHVPADSEWMTMEVALGMSEAEVNNTGWRGTDQGMQMKTAYGWFNGGNGTNAGGFAGLPGGSRGPDGNFGVGGYGGYWWTSSQEGSNIWDRYLGFDKGEVNRGNLHSPDHGFSIRCIQDSE